MTDQTQFNFNTFKDIHGYEGLYLINEIGIVYACPRVWLGHNGAKRSHDGKVLKKTNVKGYEMVSLCKNGKDVRLLVHRLVATMFVLNPDNLPDVNHKNGVKNDNRAENLEWCTHQQNIQHAHALGLASTKAAVEKTSIKIKNTLTGQFFLSAEKAANFYGFSRRHLLNMLHGKYKNNTDLVIHSDKS